jgi:NAD(P)-dependent dehydrogenase (short-subunit alcohol dehydrogenase family)
MSHELAGRVALVTGASKGIGAGVATAFGGAGANVAVGFARDKKGADRAVGEIEAAGGRSPFKAIYRRPKMWKPWSARPWQRLARSIFW